MMIAQREQPVAIILEVDHPGSTGWHTLRSLKMNDITGKIPVIVCSWLDEKDRCLEEGVDVYLRMPILYEDFEKALSHMGILPCE
jgi:CheY-like chemotaxis protein